MAWSRLVGSYRGRDLYRASGTDSYFYRAPTGDDRFGPTHDRHARVCLGTFDAPAEALGELVRRVDETWGRRP